jgi:hypothetical protein
METEFENLVAEIPVAKKKMDDLEKKARQIIETGNLSRPQKSKLCNLLKKKLTKTLLERECQCCGISKLNVHKYYKCNKEICMACVKHWKRNTHTRGVQS